jgi:hypothetical protein
MMTLDEARELRQELEAVDALLKSIRDTWQSNESPKGWPRDN